MAKILIVDDEVLIAEQLKKYILEAGHTCCGHATCYKEAVELLEKEKPNLVLLDIQIYGNRNGIDLARYINSSCHTPFIYLTSHFENSTVMDAASTRPAGYLTKPYQVETLKTTIEICLYNNLLNAEDSQVLEILEGKKIHTFVPEEIYYVVAEQVYAKVVSSKSNLTIRKSLQEIARIVEDNQFLRVHKSYIVNLRHIKQVTATYVVVNNTKIPVGRTFKEEVISIIKSHPQKI
jgi:two-component system, LytTR family, response regulator LytT